MRQNLDLINLDFAKASGILSCERLTRKWSLVACRY